MSLNGVFKGLSLVEIGALFDQLEASGTIALLWHALFTSITMAIVMSGVREGIERWASVMTRGLLIMLVILFLFSLSLEGFYDACAFVFFPQWYDLNLHACLEAAGLAFYAEPGQGIMITYGSYMKKEVSVVRMACVVAFSAIVVAIFSSLIVCSVIFSFEMPSAQEVGLVFKTLPFSLSASRLDAHVDLFFFSLSLPLSSALRLH